MEELNEIKQQLKDMLKERLDIDYEELGVDNKSPLFDEDAWGIDSIDLLDVVLGIEQIFGVTIKQGEGVKQHFQSINTLSEYIHNLKQETPA